MNDYVLHLIKKRNDAQSQLDELKGENPREAAILEQQIRTLDARLSVERPA